MNNSLLKKIGISGLTLAGMFSTISISGCNNRGFHLGADKQIIEQRIEDNKRVNSYQDNISAAPIITYKF